MKAVILAGGFGTRIGGRGMDRPKPMIEVGGRPILWHIMKIYSSWGVDEFIICGGFRQEVIREYFAGLFLEDETVTFDFRKDNSIAVRRREEEPWKVTVADTGRDTMTGGRLLRVKELIGGETFLMTYGDGVSDTDIPETIRFHRQHGRLATITAVQPQERFGVLDLGEGDEVRRFTEKSPGGRGWINGGFMVLEPEVLDLIDGDSTVFEREPLERLAADGQLRAWRHRGFWQCMDTARDREYLEELISGGRAPWMVWEEKK